MSEPSPSLSHEISAAIDWWRAAGVDLDFDDDATAWLGAVADTPSAAGGSATRPQGAGQSHGAAAAQTSLEERQQPPAHLLGESPPATLDAFREFWMSASGLDAIGPRGRIPPRGATNPDLMVIVIDPEEQDRDTLLSGPQGRLLQRMLAAMGFKDEQVYIASALPRHTPMADTKALARSGMDAVLTHHVNLVAPQRTIAFGTNVLPLLQHGVTKGETSLREINQNASPQGLLVSEALDSMMTMPKLKRRFWRRWIEWSAKE